nr:unnamed protein product [Callosobruchus analis]
MAANNFSPTTRGGRPRLSGISSIVESEDSIVSTEQVSEILEYLNNTQATDNKSVKREKGKSIKSERISHNGDAHTKRTRNNCALLPIGSSNDIKVLKKQDASQYNDVITEPLKNTTLSAKDVIPLRRRGRTRKSLTAVCQSSGEKVQFRLEELQSCKLSTNKLKEKKVSPIESNLVNKSSSTANTLETEPILVTKELTSHHVSQINNELADLRESSPEARLTRSRSQELTETNAKSQLHITHPLVPLYDNTEIEKNLNSNEQKLIQAFEIQDLSFKGKSSGYRRSGRLRETREKKIDSVGTNTIYSLENRLSPNQNETPKNRTGRSDGRTKTAESTLTCSAELASKNLSDFSRPQADNDLNSSISITDEVLSKQSTSIGASFTVFEQNKELVTPKGHGENSLNNQKKQSVQISNIGTLPSKQDNIGDRKFGKLRETQVENGNLFKINTPHSLGDMLKPTKQSEIPKGRRSRSKTADSTLITHSSELDSKSTDEVSRYQNENDLNSSTGLATDVHNGMPDSTDKWLIVFEQNEEILRINGHEENFRLNMATENKAKSVEKWVEEHKVLAEGANKSICIPNDNGMILVTNGPQELKDKSQTYKERNTKMSLTRGRKLVAMIQDNVLNASAAKHFKDGNTRNNGLKESVLHSKSGLNMVKAASDVVKLDARIKEERRLTRGCSSILEQQKLVENNASDENQMQQIEKELLFNQSEERYVTEIENHGKEIEEKSANNSEENINRSKRRTRRKSYSVLIEEGGPKQDIFEDVMGYSTDSDWSQMGAETDGDEEMNQQSPKKHYRPVTSLGKRKKRRRHRSISWSAITSRCRSKCPSEGGTVGRGIRTLYHVQFFGDRGRRAWINVTKTMPFNSSNDLKAMGGYNMFYQPFMFKSRREKVNKRLKAAADEAESLKSKTIEDKQKFFEGVVKKVIEGNAVSTRHVSSVRSGKTKRRSKDQITLPPSKIVKAADKSGNRRSKRIESMEGENEIMQGEEEEKERDKDVEKKGTPIAPKNMRPPLVIPPLEELYSNEAQKALFKRNNLFKGVSKDKVCHFCLEPGAVLRCSAKCSGIYHLECSLLSSLKYSPSTKSEDGEGCVRGEVDDHVQIVTVPSCIYNTPPRRNFPPDFSNLTLAEQIDYKMKEVMHKFESKNTYANESLSASSDSNSSDKKGPVVIRHVAADSVIKEHVGKLKKPARNHVAIKLFARAEEASDSGSSKTPNASLVKRHVTADDVSFEMLPTYSKNFKCGFCLMDVEPNCFVRQKCSLYHCGRFFHPCCLKMWPQTQWSIIQHSKSKNLSDSFVCPQHVCHTCVSDDPRAATSRWWPAVILFPNEVPLNVQMVKHSIGDFVVRFFGTYNYYWVNRGRSFLFQDGDTGDGNNKVKKLDKEFKKAVEEASLAHKLKKGTRFK